MDKIRKLQKENKELKQEVKILKDTPLIKELLKGLEDIQNGRVIRK